MSDFVIIPDTSCDMTKDLRERFSIPDYIRGVVYFPDGHTEYSDIDWEIHNPKQFYESMTDKKTIYKTACAPTGEIIEVIERQLLKGKDVLVITLSSGLSGTFQTCELARKELSEKYPERKIICVDSKRYSTAISLLVILAAYKRDSGATIEQTAEFIEKYKYCVHQIGTMDDLFFLVKTGRISNFKAFFGTLVGINAMADFNNKGLAEVLGKFKGKKAAFDALIKYMRETVVNPQEQIMFIAHSNRPQAAELLAQMIEKEFSPKEIIITNVGMFCGCSIGPGLCVAFYFGTEMSEDMLKEKEIMNKIIEGQRSKK